MQKRTPAAAIKPTLEAAEAVILAEKASLNHGQTLPNERAFLLVFSALVLVSAFFLGHKAFSFKGLAYEPQLSFHRPIWVQQPVLAGVSSNHTENEAAFVHAIATAKAVRQSVRHLGGFTPPPVGTRLDEVDYRKMLAYLSQKEKITLESDARDVLAQAGYILPPSITPLEQNTSNIAVASHLDFARDVVKTILQDEVESFLGKVKLVSKVGVYVAEQGTE